VLAATSRLVHLVQFRRVFRLVLTVVVRFVALPVVRRARHLCVFLCISRARSRSPFTRLYASFKWCAACLVLFWRRRRRKTFSFFFCCFCKSRIAKHNDRSIESIDTQHSHTFVWLACEKHIVRSRRPSSKSRDLFFFREERTRKRRERTHIQKQLLSCSAFPSSLLVRYARERERERKKHARQTPRERILFKRRRRRR